MWAKPLEQGCVAGDTERAQPMIKPPLLEKQLTAMILTYNEEPNLQRALDALTWVSEILIIDSGSTDNTLIIASKYLNTRVVTRPFDTFADQCNFGLSLVKTPWVLSLDADYELSPMLIDEIRSLEPHEGTAGYRVGFIYRIFGRALRASLYPPRTVLYQQRCGSYRNEGHGHRLKLDGETTILKGKISHDDRKSLAVWFSAQQRYARREAEHLLTAAPSSFSMADRIRIQAWPAPILVFLYTLIWKRCLFDGWAGWLYVLQRTLAEVLLAIEIVDQKLRAQLYSRDTK